MYSITAESAHHPDILALITALDRYQSVLYPAESNHLLDLTELPDDSLILMIIRDTQLNAVGCGAVVLNGDGTGEMKRVYIDPARTLKPPPAARCTRTSPSAARSWSTASRWTR